MICDGLLHFIFPFIYSVENALKPAIMPNECVINSVFVFAQNDLTNKSLQIWMQLSSPSLLPLLYT